MSLYPELNGLGLTELAEAFHQPAPEGDEFAFAYYSEIAWRLRQQGEAGNTALWNEIGKANMEQLRAILVALTASVTAHPQFKPLGDRRLLELRDLLKTYLEHTEPLLVADAMDGLGHLGEKDALNQVLSLRDHSSPFVRGSVLRYMARLWPEQAFQLLIEALSDQHFIVRENALDELGELGRPEAISHIQPYLTDEHPDVRQATQTAIEVLTQIQSY